MKKVLLILALSGSCFAMASDALILRSDAVIVMKIGSNFVEIPPTPVTLDEYKAIVSQLDEVIKAMGLFDGAILSAQAVKEKGGWGWYLSKLFEEGTNRDRLKGNNRERVKKRVLLNQFLRPIHNGLTRGGTENVAIVEYLLNKLARESTHMAYSYKLMAGMSIDDKKAKLDDVILGYIQALDELEASAKD